MAVDKLVDSTQLNSDLTSVANAIRTKGGTSAQLAFPAGFVSAIGDISTGGGDTEVLIDSGTYTVTSESSSVTIPVDMTQIDNTKITKIAVIKKTVTASVGQSKDFLGVWPRNPDTITNITANFSKSSQYSSAGNLGTYACCRSGSTASILTYTETGITINQYSNNFRIQPDDYDWYVWGVAAS